MPTRPLKRWTPQIVRDRMQCSNIVRRLLKHTMGEIEMSATQVRAAEILLKKCLPDLTSVEHSGEVKHRNVEEWSNAELVDYLAQIRAEREGDSGSVAARLSPPDDAGVH